MAPQYTQINHSKNCTQTLIPFPYNNAPTVHPTNSSTNSSRHFSCHRELQTFCDYTSTFFSNRSTPKTPSKYNQQFQIGHMTSWDVCNILPYNIVHTMHLYKFNIWSYTTESSSSSWEPDFSVWENSLSFNTKQAKKSSNFQKNKRSTWIISVAMTTS